MPDLSPLYALLAQLLPFDCLQAWFMQQAMLGLLLLAPMAAVMGIVVAALKALSEEGTVPVAKVAEAIAKYGIQADKINPLYA